MSCAMATELKTQSTNPATQLLTTIRAVMGKKACQADDLNCARTTRLKSLMPFIIHSSPGEEIVLDRIALSSVLLACAYRRRVIPSSLGPVEAVPGITNPAEHARSFALKKKIAKTPSWELSRLGLVYLS